MGGTRRTEADMVLEILSPATFNVLSPQTRATQEGLKSELDTMTVGLLGPRHGHIRLLL